MTCRRRKARRRQSSRTARRATAQKRKNNARKVYCGVVQITYELHARALNALVAPWHRLLRMPSVMLEVRRYTVSTSFQTVLGVQ
jgi:hypothetical protein